MVRSSPQNSIRSRILLGLLGVSLLPLIALFAGNEVVHQRSLRRAEYQKLSELSREVTRQIAAIMKSASAHLESAVSNPTLTDPSTSDEKKMSELRRLGNIYHYLFSDITLLNQRGIVLASTAQERPLARDESVQFERALGGGKAVGNVCREFNEEGLYFTVYLPVKYSDQHIERVVSARVNFASVSALLEGVTLGASGYMELVDSLGNVLASPNRDRILRKFYGDKAFDADRWNGVVEDVQKGMGGRECLVLARTLPKSDTQVDQSWVLFSFEPMDEVNATLADNRYLHLVAALSALAFAIVVGIFIAQWLSRPLEEAAETAEKVQAGDAVATMAERGPAEVRNLAYSFNRMLTEIRGHRVALETKVAERTEKLQNLAAQLRATYESIQEAILVVTRQGEVIASNVQLSNVFGFDPALMESGHYDELCSTLVGRFVEADDFGALWASLSRNANESCKETEWLIDADGEQRLLTVYSAPVGDFTGEPFARLWMFRDVTEKHQLQASLQQATKMEAVGRLAGGIAHDFNNLLTGILGNLSVLELEDFGGDDKPELANALKFAKAASNRAADLVRQLLGFSRKKHLELTHCQANEIVEEVCGLLQRAIDPRISIDAELSEDLWAVHADSTQLQQILMNLCTNARDALGDGGQIHLRSDNIVLVEPLPIGSEVIPAGEYVHLSVEDSGAGIPEEILVHIFEPFFTTKEKGKGTGLGLANCYGIVKQHGGWIGCVSCIDVGTTFHIYLPKTEMEAPEPVEAPATTLDLTSHGETVLIVDDENVVRMVADVALRKYGYNVIEAEDGQEAVDLFKGRLGRGVDLVILDLTMPKLSGRDTIVQLRKLTDVPIVICSGYDIDLDEFEEEVGVRPEGFLQKPFDVKSLATKVCEALKSRGVSASL